MTKGYFRMKMSNGTAEKTAHRIRFYRPDTLSSINCMTLDESNGEKRLGVLRRRFVQEDQKDFVDSNSSLIEIWNLTENPYVEQVIREDDSQRLVIENIVWGKSGRLFASTLTGYCLEYDLDGGQVKQKKSVAGGQIWSMAISKSKNHLIFGSENGSITMYKLGKKLKEKFDFKRIIGKCNGRVMCLEFHDASDKSNSRIFAGSVGTIYIWSVDKNRCLEVITVGDEVIVWCLALLKDGKALASGDSRGCTTFWDVTSATLIQEFQSHQSDVLSITAATKTVFSSGIDPVICQFRIDKSDIYPQPSLKSNHSHDVRSLLIDSNDHIYSGGVDTQIVETICQPKAVYRYPQFFNRKFKMRNNMLMAQYNAKIELYQLKIGVDASKDEDPHKKACIVATQEITCVDFLDDLIVYSTFEKINVLKILQDKIVKVDLTFDIPEDNTIDNIVIHSSSKIYMTSGLHFYQLEFNDTGSLDMTLNITFEHRVQYLLTSTSSSSSRNVVIILQNNELFQIKNGELLKDHSFELQSSPTAACISPFEEDILWLTLANKCLVKFNLNTNYIDGQESLVDFEKRQVFRGIFCTENSILIYTDSKMLSFDPKSLSFKTCIAEFDHLMFAASASTDSNPTELVLVELTKDTLKQLLPPSFEKKLFGKC